MKKRGATPEEDRALGSIEEGEITKVVPYSDESGWSITTASGWSSLLLASRAKGMTPKVGDTFTTFGQSGYPFHGQALGGVTLWYQSIEEEEAERQERSAALDRLQREQFEADRERLDADYEALPETFQERIDKFRRTNPDFRWKFESYEMVCCTDALKIAAYCSANHIADIRTFKDLPWEEQRKAGIDEGHSGNSFDVAVRLASLWVTNPNMVVLEHGALVPLVGCTDYGCPHTEPVS